MQPFGSGPYSSLTLIHKECLELEFSEVQLRAAERRSVTRVMLSSSCPHASPR
jgi:hypothetical protein